MSGVQKWSSVLGPCTYGLHVSVCTVRLTVTAVLVWTLVRFPFWTDPLTCLGSVFASGHWTQHFLSLSEVSTCAHCFCRRAKSATQPEPVVPCKTLSYVFAYVFHVMTKHPIYISRLPIRACNHVSYPTCVYVFLSHTTTTSWGIRLASNQMQCVALANIKVQTHALGCLDMLFMVRPCSINDLISTLTSTRV